MRSASAVDGPTAATDTPREGPGVAQLGHEALDRVDRRQHDPAMVAHLRRGRPQRGAAVGGIDLAGQRELQSARPRPLEAVDEALGPRARARHHHRAPRQRPLGPAGRRVERGHLADNDDGGWAQVDPLQAAQGGPHHPLGGRRSARDDGDRRVGRPPSVHERVGDGRPRRHAHEDHQRPAGLCQRLPIGSAGPAGLADPARHHGDRRGQAALGDGDAGRGGDTEGGRDAGDHLPGDARLGQHLDLLAAPAEEERVAPLEAHHDRRTPARARRAGGRSRPGARCLRRACRGPCRRRSAVPSGAPGRGRRCSRGGRATPRRPGPAVGLRGG